MEYDVLLNIDDIINGPELIVDDSLRFSNYDIPIGMETDKPGLLESNLSRQSPMAADMVRVLQSRSGIEDSLVSKSATILYSLLDLMEDRMDIQDKVLRLGRTSEESIVVDFSPERNMRLVIYYNDDVQEDEDVEEAFLDYEINGEYYLVNNTLYQIAEKLKELLP